MKKIITILLVVITLFGCSGKDSAKKIEFRKEKKYTLHGNKPYTGEGVLYYDKNNIESRGYSKNGKMEGHWIYYYYSGEVEGEVNYKEGKEI